MTLAQKRILEQIVWGEGYCHHIPGNACRVCILAARCIRERDTANDPAMFKNRKRLACEELAKEILDEALRAKI